MRKAALALALLLAACEVESYHAGEVKMLCGPERPCNTRVIAPPQFIGASISVDGQEATQLFSNDLGHPVRSLVLRLFGMRRHGATALWHVPRGTHTLRIVKPGFEPVERVIDVGDYAAIQLCPSDLRPLK